MIDTSESKTADALGGKTARACESCLLKRARWFCAADDAFLCQSCDASVHSANQLASRHRRVRLKTSSFKATDVKYSTPAWHQGFTKKARTPRQAKSTRLQPPANHPLPLVPEINGEDPFLEENDELDLFHQVPVFEPFGNEFGSEILKVKEGADHDLNLEELLSTCDEDLVEFAADVDSLFGTTGTGEGSGSGINEQNGIDEYLDGNEVKVEEDCDDEVQAVLACHFDPALDMELNWDFHYASSLTREAGEEIKREAAIETTLTMDSGNESQVKKRLLLRLNYEAAIAAWASQGSPWTNGVRPQFDDLDEFTVACMEEGSHQCGGFGGRSGANDAGREARVSRYREKKRTRLFSKKIRYQVRKLNAEKRPRMKGRFVKRTTFQDTLT